MAVTSIWSIKGWIGKVINYAENPDKTKENNEGQIAEDQSRSTQGLNDVITYAVNAEKIRRRQSESMEMELVGEAEELMEQYRKNIGKVKENLKRMLPEIGLIGQWSMDIMQNGNDFYLIDMALAENSALKECVPKSLLKKVEEDWIPRINTKED